MKKKVIVFLICALPLLAISCSENTSESKSQEPGWKAGVASVVITPEQSLWMAGYAGRDHSSEGKVHDLRAKALVLQDSSNNKVVLITCDLLGTPKFLSDTIRNRLEKKYDLSRAQINLNSSHTHTGPVLNVGSHIYEILDSEQLDRIRQYLNTFESKIVSLVGEALESMEPVDLYSQNGITRFQVNRRNNKEALLTPQTELNGPNDYAVPVIKVAKKTGDILAIVFGYACHANNSGQYEFSGDYPGFAQLELENAYPGTTALFFQGAAGDQNPLPRKSMINGKLTGSMAFAQQYGKELVAAVEKVLSEDMHKLSPVLKSEYSEIELPFAEPLSKDELQKMTEEYSDQKQRWASRMLSKLENNEPIMKYYPYPIQVWKLGEQAIISLGGEPVIAYDIELKKIFGQDIFVMGYSNDVMSYIPSAVILGEGGYEAYGSQIVYGMPSTWKPEIEQIIIKDVETLAEKAGVQPLTKTQEL